MGVVIRDETGKFLLAAVLKQQGEWRPLQAEAAALELGIQLAISRDFLKVEVECDNLMVVNGLRQPALDDTDVGIVLACLIVNGLSPHMFSLSPHMFPVGFIPCSYIRTLYIVMWLQQ
ncbi:hypothetical protein LINGRAPRIM_LOCUS2715 [Linum grandiflorum]